MWAATSMPVIRRQWCDAMEAAAELSFEHYRDALPQGVRPQPEPVQTEIRWRP